MYCGAAQSYGHHGVHGLVRLLLAYAFVGVPSPTLARSRPHLLNRKLDMCLYAKQPIKKITHLTHFTRPLPHILFLSPHPSNFDADHTA